MKCMGVERKGTLSLAFPESVDHEGSVRISKYLGVVRDGNEGEGDRAIGQQANCVKEHLRVSLPPRGTQESH